VGRGCLCGCGWRGPPSKVEEVKNELYLSYYEHKTGGEPLSDGDWPDYSDTDIDWGLQKCFKDKEKAPWLRQVEQVDFVPKVGDTVYVVYVRYGTGDTFGRVNGAWHILGVYEHQGQAEKVKNSVYDKTYKGYKCWEGYFESCESCEVEAMVVE
jgi:hypothetical protein